MKRLAIILLAFLFSAILIQSCETSKEVAELPPSSIFADDDSTLLGYYSNIGKKGPNIAPYFCASLEKDLVELLAQKDSNGRFIYHKKNGEPYNVFKDELRIYTSVNPSLQKHAEAALKKHLKEDLQPAFSKNNGTTKHFPFSNTYNGTKVTEETIDQILHQARKNSERYLALEKSGSSKKEILKSFDVPTKMKVFSWQGDIDTTLTPNDSILYYKNFIRSGFLSIEPSTGYIKAWVGGIDFNHFPLDHVKEGKRQIGSIIKPFIYATAFSMGVIEPCTKLSQEPYCVDPCDPTGRRWCPSGTPAKNVIANFTQTGGGVNVSIMSKMGACSGPQTVARLFERMNIIIPEEQVVPSMCLGTPDMSLLEIVAAQAMFVNNGVYIAPQSIRRIEDKHGNVIYSSSAIQRKVMNPTISHDIIQLMKGVVTSGTSTSLKWHKKWGGITHPTAGKPGTTQGNSDAWFVGMTPDLVTGIWTGGEDKQIRFRSMTWGQGARAALPIYGYYMQQVYADSTLNVSTEDFKAPESYDPSRFDCDPQKSGEPFR